MTFPQGPALAASALRGEPCDTNKHADRVGHRARRSANVLAGLGQAPPLRAPLLLLPPQPAG